MKMKEKTKVIAICRVGASLKSARKLAGFEKQREAVARAADWHDLEVIDEIELTGTTESDARPTAPEIDMLLDKLRNREIQGVVVTHLDRFPSLNSAIGMRILDGLVEAKGRIYTEDQVIELGTRDGRFEAMLRINMIHDYRQSLINRSITDRAMKRKERSAKVLEQNSAMKSGTPDGPAAPRA